MSSNLPNDTSYGSELAIQAKLPDKDITIYVLANLIVGLDDS
ncbi:MAG: hypothetical protein WCP03_02595 [Candidatus Saccharibacteria bacterium]